MRKVAIALGVLAVAVALVVGIRQARESSPSSAPAALTRAEVSQPIPGAPPELVALRRQVNVLRGGGLKAFEAQVRALRGHPVVVNFWASWCGPCRRELPSFQREAVKRGASVAFLGVNSGDDSDAAMALAREFPMPYPSYSDPRDNIVKGRFGARGLPVTAFYDARGELAIVRQGEFADRRTLAEAIDRYALR
jgi:thiol-disulfide isomerase/thioredoxin